MSGASAVAFIAESTGLVDAHVHPTANTANLPGLLTQPESLVAVKAANILQGMLRRGFTTIRVRH